MNDNTTIISRPNIQHRLILCPYFYPGKLKPRIKVFMELQVPLDVLLNHVKFFFDKQLEQKDTREHQRDVTLIVNPFSLPLIFHGFSCLLDCFPAQSADWRHFLRFR